MPQRLTRPFFTPHEGFEPIYSARAASTIRLIIRIQNDAHDSWLKPAMAEAYRVLKQALMSDGKRESLGSYSRCHGYG
jgi:hypothetical protein